MCPTCTASSSGIATILKPDGHRRHRDPVRRRPRRATRVRHDLSRARLLLLAHSLVECPHAGHGLIVTDVERMAIHGGSLRVFAAHAGGRSRCPPSRLSSPRKTRSVWRASATSMPSPRRSGPSGDELRAVAVGHQGAGRLDRGLRSRRQGCGPAQCLRHRRRDDRLRRRPQPAQAGPLHARGQVPVVPAERLLEAMPDVLSRCSPGTSRTRSSAADRVPRGRRPVHHPRPRTQAGLTMIEGVRIVPLRASPTSAGRCTHMLSADRPPLRRIRGDLLLHRLPRRGEGLAPPRADDAQLRLHQRPDEARPSRRPRRFADRRRTIRRSSSGQTTTPRGDHPAGPLERVQGHGNEPSIVANCAPTRTTLTIRPARPLRQRPPVRLGCAPLLMRVLVTGGDRVHRLSRRPGARGSRARDSCPRATGIASLAACRRHRSDHSHRGRPERAGNEQACPHGDAAGGDCPLSLVRATGTVPHRHRPKPSVARWLDPAPGGSARLRVPASRPGGYLPREWPGSFAVHL